MTTTQRVRAALGIDKHDIPVVIERATAMHDGMFADTAVYTGPIPSLLVFLGLIQNLVAAQKLVPAGTKGMAAKRNVERDILFTGMESERMFVQTLADASPLHAIAIIQNAGLLVAGLPLRAKPVLALALGKQSGSVHCDANVGQLAGPGKIHRARFFNWEYTVDGGVSFITATPSPTGKTTLHNLAPLTTVGVRVNLHDLTGPGPWSQVVTILVR